CRPSSRLSCATLPAACSTCTSTAASRGAWPEGELSMLTEGERRQQLDGSGRSAPTVVELFEEQARRRPEAVAVTFQGGELSYGELNRRANQLAHYLRALGACPEVKVGVCLERSPEMVIGLLGVLKAGAVYLPLDLSYPKERLAYMLADAGAELLVTHRQALKRE